MKEYDLQMAWKLSVLAGQSLKTVQGDTMEIIFPGYGPSSLGGPDFTYAKIKINDTLWVGSVEIHLLSSQWYAHKHHQDEKYNNVILHVVWENDADVTWANELSIPCLQVKDFFSASWFDEVDQRIFSAQRIPCAELIHLSSELVWQSQLDVSLIERVERRVKEVEQLYLDCQWDWDEALHRFLARFMGQKINNDCMEQVARAIPYRIILKHTSSLPDLEALLLGQGGFLNEKNKDEYTKDRSDRYLFLCHKYGLSKVYNGHLQWQYKGLRPVSFPELRIAQWAYLLHSKGRLMHWALETPIKDLLRESHDIGTYWKSHYRLGQNSKESVRMNAQWSTLVVINALIPFRIAYKKNKDSTQTSMLIDAYEEIPPEKNRVIRLFEAFGHHAVSARDTQAMLELYNNYCNYKKCLSCKIGHVILKKEGLL
ncbi:MAG: hypothetical protein K0R51_1736 [Cytophagaceae bacterium]|jgi:hypothetical protein|nr:hypothetical protein [Cytophagaceae bacterium]